MNEAAEAGVSKWRVPLYKRGGEVFVKNVHVEATTAERAKETARVALPHGFSPYVGRPERLSASGWCGRCGWTPHVGPCDMSPTPRFLQLQKERGF